MTHSESLNELAGALAKAQAVMKGAPRDAQNPHFRSRFASLASVWEACREALTSNGLSVIQMPGPAGEGAVDLVSEGEILDAGRQVVVTTMLLHSSGQWIRDSLTMTARDATPQSIGSAISYARRYGLQAAVGICAEDDDAEAAMGRQAPQAQAQDRTPAPVAAREARPVAVHRPNGNGHGHDQPRQYDGPPRSGKALFAWVKDQEQRFNYPSLLKEVNAWAKRMGYPGRMTEFDASQVAEAHAAAVEVIRINFGEDEVAALMPAGREPGQEG